MTITSMLKDRYGFLWFGTQSGLNRFDGYKFTQHLNSHNRKGSIHAGYILSLFEDKQGYIWIGTLNSGLIQYNPLTDTAKAFRSEPQVTSSISSNTVVDMVEDEQGILWLATANGLNRFDRKTQAFKSYQYSPNHDNTISSNKLTALLIDNRGFIWIATGSAGLRENSQGGLNIFNPATEQFIRLNHDADDITSISNNNIVSIAQDKQKQIWIGTYAGELDRIDPINYKVTRSPMGNLPKSENISDIYIDKLGTLWAGLAGAGLLELNTQSFEYKIHSHQRDDANSLSSNDLTTVFGDGSGLIWVGSWNNGVDRFSLFNRNFQTFDPNIPKGWGITGQSILGVAVSGDEMWLAAWEKGLLQVNLSKKSTLTYAHHKDDQHSISAPVVRAVCIDKSGTLWLGTRSGGLNRFNRQSKTFTRYLHQANNPDSLSNNHVTAITQGPEGFIWIGTRGGGINKLNPETGKFFRLETLENEDNHFSSKELMSLYFDPTGKLWAGTMAGLNVFDPLTGQIKIYQFDENDPHSIGSGLVTSAYQDDMGTTWVGTQNGGLNKVIKNKDGLSFERLTIDDGLASNAIGMILADQANNLWLSTTKGISKFNPVSKKIENFYRNDGTIQGGYYINSGAVGNDGRLYFGGISGVTRLDPANFSSPADRPELVLTNFLLFNKSVELKSIDFRSPLRKAIYATEEVVLNHNQTVFGFEFSVLDYFDPPRNKYAYKLEGFDKDWVTTTSDKRYATYTNLSAGNYIFRFKGANKNGAWHENEQSLHVTILAAPWQTWWAYSLYSLTILAIVLGFGYQKVKNHFAIKERNEQLRLVLWGSGDELWDINLADNTIVSQNRPDCLEPMKNRPFQIPILNKAHIHPEDRAKVAQKLENHLNGIEKFYEVAYRVRTRTGDWLWLLDKGMVVNRNAKGVPLRLSGTTKNIHRLKMQEAELLALNKNLEHKVELRTKELKQSNEELKETQTQLIESEKMASLATLVVGISHELNTPLGIATTALSHLNDCTCELFNKAEQGKLSKTTFSHFKLNADNSISLGLSSLRRASDIVEDFKLVAADRSGEELHTVAIDSLLHEAVRSVSLLEHINADDIKVICPPGLMITTYSRILFQVLKQLLQNSIKHGFELNSNLEISIKVTSENESLILHFQDHGKGMEQKTLERIFEPFFTTSRGENIGLGLYVVYNQVSQLLKGTINCTSKPDQGCIFTLYLPVSLD